MAPQLHHASSRNVAPYAEMEDARRGADAVRLSGRVRYVRHAGLLRLSSHRPPPTFRYGNQKWNRIAARDSEDGERAVAFGEQRRGPR
jgi:hypothetical protein